MLLNGGSERSFSLYVVFISKKRGCSSLGKYIDPGVIWVIILTPVPDGEKMGINVTHFILNLNC